MIAGYQRVRGLSPEGESLSFVCGGGIDGRVRVRSQTNKIESVSRYDTSPSARQTQTDVPD
jgi:hypothetical protein